MLDEMILLILNTKYQCHIKRIRRKRQLLGKVCLFFFVCQQKCIWDNRHTIVGCPVQWHHFFWVLQTGCLFYLCDYLNTLPNVQINNPCSKNQEPNDKWISFNYFNYPTDVFPFFALLSLVLWLFECFVIFWGLNILLTDLYVIQHTYKSFKNLY